MDRFRFASIVITLIATVVAMTSTFTSSWLVVKERNTTIRSGLMYRCEDDSCLLVIEETNWVFKVSFVLMLFSDFLLVVGLGVISASNKRTRRKSFKIGSIVIFVAGISDTISCAFFTGMHALYMGKQEIYFGYSHFLGWVSVGLAMMCAVCCRLVVSDLKEPGSPTLHETELITLHSQQNIKQNDSKQNKNLRSTSSLEQENSNREQDQLDME